jgi:Ca2+-transporting ATPase
LVLTEFFKAFCFRSDRHSTFHRPFANKWLNLAIFWELLLLALIVHVPFMEKAFGTYNLPLTDWAIAGGLAVTILPVIEVGKWVIRRSGLDRRTWAGPAPQPRCGSAT